MHLRLWDRTNWCFKMTTSRIQFMIWRKWIFLPIKYNSKIQLYEKSKQIRVNFAKTKSLTRKNIKATIDVHVLEIVDKYIHYGHNRKLGQMADLSSRTRLSWAAFGYLSYILEAKHISINLERKVYDSCILPVDPHRLEETTSTKRRQTVHIAVSQRNRRSLLLSCPKTTNRSIEKASKWWWDDSSETAEQELMSKYLR